MRISDWSSDVCSSDLAAEEEALRLRHADEHDDEGDHVEEDRDDRHDDDEHAEDQPRSPARTGGGHEDSAADALRQRRMALRRRYKIQDVIRRRQVQHGRASGRERGCPYVYIAWVDVS